jgi:hypothetical protein
VEGKICLPRSSATPTVPSAVIKGQFYYWLDHVINVINDVSYYFIIKSLGVNFVMVGSYMSFHVIKCQVISCHIMLFHVAPYHFMYHWTFSTSFQ